MQPFGCSEARYGGGFEMNLPDGTEMTYFSLHRRLRRENPKSGICDDCGASGKTEYALLPGKNYSLSRNDYAELCRRCHMVVDGIFAPGGPALTALRSAREKDLSATHCRSGHRRTEANTYLEPDGTRQCRECRRLAKLRWQEKRLAV